MPLKLARNEAILGPDEMQDFNDLPIAGHSALRRERDRQDHGRENQDKDHRRDEDDGFRHDGKTLEP